MATESECGPKREWFSHMICGRATGWSFAYVRGVRGLATLEGELRGRFWFNHFGRQSLCLFAIAPQGSIGRRVDLATTFV
jgi:hypothetical protein